MPLGNDKENDEVVSSSMTSGDGENIIKVGEKDLLGYKVDRLFSVSDFYYIYESNRKVRYCFRHKNQPEQEKSMLKNLYPFVDELCIVEDVVCSMEPVKLRTGGTNEKYECYKTRVYDFIAKIMAACFAAHIDSAQNLINELTALVESRRDSENRMKYLMANIASFLFFLGLCIWLKASNVIPYQVQNTAHAIDIVTLGVLGAFFSVAIGANGVNVKHSVTVAEMIYTGFIRIPIGIIAAIVVIFLIEGKWILGSLESDAKIMSLYLFGFLAGFSESFIPNTLKQVDSSTSIATPGAGKTKALLAKLPD